MLPLSIVFRLTAKIDNIIINICVLYITLFYIRLEIIIREILEKIKFIKTPFF